MNTYKVSQDTANWMDCRRALFALETAIRHALAYETNEDPGDGERVEESMKNVFNAPLQTIENALNDVISETVKENIFEALRQNPDAPEIAL